MQLFPNTGNLEYQQEKENKMKKIIGLTIAAILVIGLVAGGTLAYFSDTETSTANVFTAGTLDLKTNDVDSVTATWTDTNMAPGGTAVNASIILKNSGTLAANHIEIKFSNAITNVVTPAEIGTDDIDMSDSLNVTVMTYDGTDLLLQTVSGTFDNATIDAADLDNNDIITLQELDAVMLSFTNVPTPSGAATKTFSMSVQLASSTDNGNQGDTVTTTVTFGLFQDASQSLP